jgi:MurNAc alpha-1-phosphate uridylyltransferase
MRPLTDERPKALVEVGGRPLIEHALEQVAGAAPVAVNAHHRAAQLRAHLAGRADVAVMEERPRVLETGGGLRHALPALGATDGRAVVTMNSDAAWTGPRAIETMRAAWDPARMDGLLLVVPLARAVGHGRADFGLDGAGRLLRGAAADHVYTGAGLLRTDGLAGVAEEAFSLWALWAPMLEAGRLHGVVHPGWWADVGTPEGIAPAEAMLAARAERVA